MPQTVINPSLNNYLFDIGANPFMMGRLKLPYRAFNFLSILTRAYGADKYDKAVEMIELCHWIYNSIPDVKNIINRHAEYSITDLNIDSSTLASEDDEEIYLKLLDKLDIKSKLIEIAKTYFATGNAFASIDIKFKKHFKCPDCGIVYPARVDNFGFKKNKKTRKIYFTSKCENSKCKYNGRVETIDIKIKKPENIKVKIWDWHDIDFNWN